MSSINSFPVSNQRVGPLNSEILDTTWPEAEFKSRWFREGKFLNLLFYGKIAGPPVSTTLYITLPQGLEIVDTDDIPFNQMKTIPLGNCTIFDSSSGRIFYGIILALNDIQITMNFANSFMGSIVTQEVGNLAPIIASINDQYSGQCLIPIKQFSGA